MHQDNLKLLFKEYKNCMRNQFTNYFGKDDEYISYKDKCWNQWNDIKKYYNSHLNKVYYVMPSREEQEIEVNVSRRYRQFESHGWSENQVRNYFLNYEKSQQEYDVWANHIMAQESDETNGLLTNKNKYEFGNEERLPFILKNLVKNNKPLNVLTDLKFKGNAQDYDLLEDIKGSDTPIVPFS